MCVPAGADVARKVVIVARECGLQLGLSDLQVSSLVPLPLQGLSSVDEVMQQLPQVGNNADRAWKVTTGLQGTGPQLQLTMLFLQAAHSPSCSTSLQQVYLHTFASCCT
jgi:homoserine dehydrogenase